MTNKPDTWKDWMKTYDNGSGGIDSEQIPVLLKYISSSQALARREGIEEAMRVVEGIIANQKSKAQALTEYTTNFSTAGAMGLCDELKDDILQALQEKLDTKGE